jgi:hypothetical protein
MAGGSCEAGFGDLEAIELQFKKFLPAASDCVSSVTEMEAIIEGVFLFPGFCPG